MFTEFLTFDRSDLKNDWDTFVENHPNGTPFHLTGWLQSIEKSFRFKNLSLIIRNSEGTIIAIFPAFLIHLFGRGRRLLSLPFSDYGGVIFNNSAQYDARLFLKIFRDKFNPDFIEVRGDIFKTKNFCTLDYYKYHRLYLTMDKELLWKRIDNRTVKYSIRKARKNGVIIREQNDSEGLSEFQRLHFLTRKKHGVPSQPSCFFTNIFKYLISQNKGFLLLAYFKDVPVAGSLFLKCGKGIFYKYNASDPNMVRKVTPNHLLTWQAIEKSKIEGYHFIDFGRTSPDNTGLMRYKSNWGTTIHDLPYFFCPSIHGACSVQESSPLFRIATGVWRKLPDWMAKTIGSHLYRYLA